VYAAGGPVEVRMACGPGPTPVTSPAFPLANRSNRNAR